MRRLLLYFIALLFPVPAFAQFNVIVEHYSAENGLPNDVVYCSLKGSDGFIWFGTWYGLCNFDGQKFNLYNERNEYFPDIPPRKISNIVEDKNGFLWIATSNNKLHVFDKYKEQYYSPYEKIRDYSKNTQIIRMKNTPEGDVLLLTKDKNLLKVCMKEDGEPEIKLLHTSTSDINVFSSKLKHNVFSEAEDYIVWIGMDYRFFCLPKEGALRNRPADFISRQLSASPEDGFVCACHSGDTLWMSDNAGRLYMIDMKTGLVQNPRPRLFDKPVTAILPASSGKAYLLVSNRGMYEYDAGDGSLERINIPADANNVSYIIEDRRGNIVLLENPNTLIVYNPATRSANRFPSSTGSSIETFQYQETEEYAFFRMPSGKVAVYDRTKGTMTDINSLANLPMYRKTSISSI